MLPSLKKAYRYDALKDFTPIALVATSWTVFAVNPAVPANSQTEFIAYAKANPGRVLLGGSMSLVGPRPHAVAHNTEYERVVANYAFRYHVKPGISGWAQVNGFRGETSTVDLMERRVELDLWYVNNWSFWLDVRILCKTLTLGLWQATAY
jgi:sugar transferase/tripartite tricarboxylate transporter family receptor